MTITAYVPEDVGQESTVTLLQQIELLKMQVQARDEIISVYRDALEALQQEKRLASAIHMTDLSALTKPKTT